MEKITATKIEKIQDPTFEPMPDEYVVLIEETRVDDVGNEYQFVRKEITTIKDINKQIDIINEQINSLQEQKEKLQAKKQELK